jgi:hypothetical protein
VGGGFDHPYLIGKVGPIQLGRKSGQLGIRFRGPTGSGPDAGPSCPPSWQLGGQDQNFPTPARSRLLTVRGLDSFGSQPIFVVPTSQQDPPYIDNVECITH